LVLEELLKEYEGKVRVVYKHMVVHPQQVALTHAVACAAAKQGKFKEFYRAFWDRGYNQRQFGEEPTFRIAGEVGVDVERAKSDLEACQGVVQADEAELRKFKVNGTPAFFINGEFIGGGMPKDRFKVIIDKKLQIAQSSGVPGASYYDVEIRGKGQKSIAPARRRAQ
jgi:protein-disulfide isomerase